MLKVSAVTLIALLAPTLVHAQNPWMVAVTPTVSPLAIGGCGAVRLTISDPATKDWPRNPAGNYVSMATST